MEIIIGVVCVLVFSVIAGFNHVVNFWVKINAYFSPRLKNDEKVHRRIKLQKEFSNYLTDKIGKKK